jgi:hypothetical protein
MFSATAEASAAKDALLSALSELSSSLGMRRGGGVGPEGNRAPRLGASIRSVVRCIQEMPPQASQGTVGGAVEWLEWSGKAKAVAQEYSQLAAGGRSMAALETKKCEAAKSTLQPSLEKASSEEALFRAQAPLMESAIQEMQQR